MDLLASSVPKISHAAGESFFFSNQPVCTIWNLAIVVLVPELFLKPLIDLFDLLDKGSHLLRIIDTLIVFEVVRLNESADGQVA